MTPIEEAYLLILQEVAPHFDWTLQLGGLEDGIFIFYLKDRPSPYVVFWSDGRAIVIFRSDVTMLGRRFDVHLSDGDSIKRLKEIFQT